MKVPMFPRSVRPLVRWSTNHRLTAFSCAIASLNGCVITQPTITRTSTSTANVTSNRAAVRASDRSVGGEKRRPVGDM